MYNTAMTTQEFSYHIPWMSDRRKHDAASPHRVYREGGSNLWVLEYAVSGKAFISHPNETCTEVLPGTFFLFREGTFQNYGMALEFAHWEHCYTTFTPRDHWHELFCWPQLYRGAWMLKIEEPEQAKQPAAIFQQMIDSFMVNTQRRKEFLLNDLERLFLTLDLLNPLSKFGKIDSRIRNVMDYIRTQVRKEMDIPFLADLCNLSPSRFSHLFQTETGLTPMKYLEAQRLEKARALLTMTGMTIEEIAYECGFNSAFYFSRQFKKVFQYSPKHYRQAGKHLQNYSEELI